MNRLEFSRLATTRFGPTWKGKTAEFLGINRRTLSRWIGDDEIPQWAVDRLSDTPAAKLLAVALDLGRTLRSIGVATADDLQRLVDATTLYEEESGRAPQS